jgi:hypothetical protein
MSPACLTTMALIAAGTTSTRGITALAINKLRATSGEKNTPDLSGRHGPERVPPGRLTAAGMSPNQLISF